MSERVNIEAFIATDRLQAMARGEALPAEMSGALLVVDLTGYTGSVEQAERQLGAVRGADRISKAINRIFDQLICQIYRFGGVVVGFGGDALLAWYVADNGSRATASAFAMQQAVATQSHLLLAPGFPISFVLKASIATGKVQRCVVGDPQIQCFDLLTGEAINRVALVQQVTKGSDIVLDGDCAVNLSGQLQIKAWITMSNSGERFALVDRWHGSTLTQELPVAPTLPHQQLTPWLLRPIYENLLATQGQFTAAIRQVVALFFKFPLPAALLTQHGSSALDTYVRWVQHTLHRQNGYLIKLTIDNKGCYGLATFGAPQDSEDAPQRAVTAAVALCNPPSHLAFADAMQIGISQGRMLAGSFGNWLRAGYDLLGHELTIANRLMARAGVGEILVTRQIAENSQRFFKFQSLGSEIVKGAQQPVALFALLSAHNELPFDISKATLGRNTELAHLQEICQALPTSGLQVIRLVGAPGIGKTQLVAELYRRAPQWGLCALPAACERITQRVAYYPWRQIVQQLLCEGLDEANAQHSFAQIEAHWLAHLGNRFDADTLQSALADLWGHTDRQDEEYPPHGAKERQATIATVVAALLQDRLQMQPVMVIMEDVQWLDLPSFELLLNLKRTLMESPLLLLMTHRSAEDSHSQQGMAAALQQVPDSHQIEIKTFAPATSEELVEVSLGGRASRLLHALLYAQTEGNPLAVEEAVRIHQITGRIRYDSEQLQWQLSPQALQELRQARCLEIDPKSGEWQLTANAPLAQADFGTPDRLQQMIFARFDLLNAALQLTLKVASVIGHGFSLALLAAVHPLRLDRMTLHTQLTQLQQQHFLTSQSTTSGLLYRFQHQLMQEGIYESMPQDQQIALHFAVGKGLETQADGVIEQLAWHFWRCRAVHPEPALHYVKRAAQQVQNYANHTALDFYNQALQLAPDDVACLQGKIETLHILGHYDEEERVLQQLSAHPSVDALELNYLWGNYYVERENYPAAICAYEGVCQLAEARCDALQVARGLTQLGWVARKQNQLSNAQGFYERAIAVLEHLKTSDVRSAHAYSDALNGLGTLFRQLRRYVDAERYYQTALELSRREQNRREEARSLNNLGANCYYQRELEKARIYFTQSLYARRSIGDRAGEGACLANLAAICSETGEYEDAIQYNHLASQLYQALDNSEVQIISAINLGITYRELGDFYAAQEYLKQAMDLAQKIDDLDSCNYVHSNLGLVLCDLGKFEDAFSNLQSGLSYVLLHNDKIRAATFQSYLGIVYLNLGVFQQAVAMAAQAIETRSVPELLPLTADDRATLASAYLQTGRLEEALQEIEYVQMQLMKQDQREAEFPQRDWFICYQVLQTAQQGDAAQFALHQAHEIVTKRGQRLRDPDLRQRYLNAIPLHRQIRQALEKLLVSNTFV